jgi:hypothetical protein
MSLWLATALALALRASPITTASGDQISARIATMSDEDKVAQLIFVGVSSRVPDAEIEQLAGIWHVGGIVLFAHNYESADRGSHRQMDERR